MGASRSFGGSQTPPGMQHRTGTLGDAIADLRNDVDAAFVLLEADPLAGGTPESAYTQTFSTADKTHDVDGSSAVAVPDAEAMATVTTVGGNTGTAGAGLTLLGDTTTVDQASNIMNDLVALQEDILDAKTKYDVAVTLVNQVKADFNLLRTTVDDLKQLVNAVIDDLQAKNLVG